MSESGHRGESVWAAYKERQKESTAKGGGGRVIGREQEGRRRRGCPVMLKHSVFEREEGKDTGRKSGKRKENALQATQASLPCQSEERDREGETGRPGPSSGAGSIWCCRLWNE